ncbi:hypothetical protein [Nocardia sp. XZ_19_369]|uniref:hypothetical protein n=1 Tax=Nocardia sp. XZ_19_369 TaxID=2769487 RepID=UPI001E3BD30A|nr:hypothetical protein [Nocardia sp. XZ_19_369]
MGEEREGTPDKKDGIKPSQVTAAALAAVTAAFLGSTLGVAGTVAGAGIASVVSTVGGELYLRSMRKTKEAAQRTREAALALADPSIRQQAGPVQRPRQVSGQRTDNYHPPTQAWTGRRNDMRPGAGYQTPREQRQPANNRVPGVGAGRSVGEEPTVVIPQLNLRSPGAESGEEQVRRGYRLHWPLIVGTSVVGFLIAILMITGFEGVTGKSISGDEVTTVGHLWSGGGDQPDKPSPSGDDETVQPSESRVPTTTTPHNGTDGGKSTTSGPTPSTSVPKSSSPSTSAPKASAPSTSVPESSNQSRTPSLPSSNNAPGGRNQRSGSDGGDGAPGPTSR